MEALAALRHFQRPVAAIGGVAIAVAAGFYSWIIAVLVVCETAQEASDSWICAGVWRTLLGPVEIALIVGAVVGPVAGGVATARSGRWKWIGIGTTIAVVCVLIEFLLAHGQTAGIS